MDFSHAGYMGGGGALPVIGVKKTLQPSGADDTASIQAALDEVAAMPLEHGFRGAVLLGRGRSPAPARSGFPPAAWCCAAAGRRRRSN